MGRISRWRVGAAVLAGWTALGTLAAPAAEPSVFTADPAVSAALARARALRTLPCTGDASVDGFAPEAGVPAPWRVAGLLVSVRRAGGDRFAFLLDPPKPGAGDCAARDVIVLPGRGELLACALPDRSSEGIGVHARLASGRRDVLYWRADGMGGLHRLDLDAEGIESDTGALICSLPDAMP